MAAITALGLLALLSLTLFIPAFNMVFLFIVNPLIAGHFAGKHTGKPLQLGLLVAAPWGLFMFLAISALFSSMLAFGGGGFGGMDILLAFLLMGSNALFCFFGARNARIVPQ